MSIVKLEKAIEEKKIEINELQNSIGLFSDLKAKESLLINQLDNLEIELIKLNKLDKHKFIVRTYINRTGKNYTDRKFKNLNSAENFFNTQSSTTYHNGYDTRGVVFSELDAENIEHGIIKKISYQFGEPTKS